MRECAYGHFCSLDFKAYSCDGRRVIEVHGGRCMNGDKVHVYQVHWVLVDGQYVYVPDSTGLPKCQS